MGAFSHFVRSFTYLVLNLWLIQFDKAIQSPTVCCFTCTRVVSRKMTSLKKEYQLILAIWIWAILDLGVPSVSKQVDSSVSIWSIQFYCFLANLNKAIVFKSTLPSLGAFLVSSWNYIQWRTSRTVYWNFQSTSPACDLVERRGEWCFYSIYTFWLKNSTAQKEKFTVLNSS